MKSLKKVLFVLTLACACVMLSACSLNNSYKLSHDVTVQEKATTEDPKTTIEAAEDATDDASGFTMKAVITDGTKRIALTYKYNATTKPALASIKIKGGENNATVILGSEYVFFDGTLKTDTISSDAKFKMNRLPSIDLDVESILSQISSAAGDFDTYLEAKYDDKVITAGVDAKGNFIFDYDERKLEEGTVEKPAHARYVVVDHILSYVAIEKGDFNFYYELTLKTPSISEPNPNDYKDGSFNIFKK